MACENLGNGTADRTRVTFSVGLDPALTSKATKATGLVDVNDFTLIVKTEEGVTVDSLRVGEAAQGLDLAKGTYALEARSCVFEAPAFDLPCYYGATQFEVTGSASQTVSLVCTQVNAGIRVVFDPEFAEVYGTDDYYLTVTDVSQDSLIFNAQTQNRWGYFRPGGVRVKLYVDEKYLSGLLQVLNPRTKTLLTVYPEDLALTPVLWEIGVDETVVDATFSWDLNGTSEMADGLSPATALNVSQLQQFAPLLEGEQAWVTGYIVSGSISSGKVKFSPEGAGASHLALADDPEEEASSACVAIQLSTGTEPRNLLALDSHPALYKQRVWVKGTVDLSYLGLIGLEKTTQARLSLNDPAE